LLWLNGPDLRGKPLAERKRRLERLIPESTSLLSRVLTVPKNGRAPLNAAARLDLESIVAKRKADLYEHDVTWYKIKNRAYSQMEGRRDFFTRNGALSRRSGCRHGTDAALSQNRPPLSHTGPIGDAVQQ
jgi:ATP-dependent DNA ligase